MRVLFITAYFPPCQYGWGYMRICEQVADGLQMRNHQVAVLTSIYRHGEEVKPYPVHRLLRIDPDWLLKRSAMVQFFRGRQQREQEDKNHLLQLVAEFQPDVIFIWHGHGVARLVLQTAESLPTIPTVYYFANYLPELPDEYIQYWQTKGSNPLVRLLKAPLAKIALARLEQEDKPIILEYPYSISVSHYVRDRLKPLIGKDAVVIPNGIDASMFHHPVSNHHPYLIKCLIAGRVAPEKGIHTVLDAFGLLAEQDKLQDIHLTIIGNGPPEYRHQLEAIIETYNLSSYITFANPVPIEEMPQVFAEHNVLLLPSEWDEPLSCTMLEAMSSGLLVIGTTTGGSGEALFHEQTGLTYTAGDVAGLATQLERIMQDQAFVASLAQKGQQLAETEFNMDVSVERIEAYLMNLVQNHAG